MEIEQLKKKIKIIKKAKIRFDEKFRRNYKNELQKFDDEIFSINLLIESKLKNSKIIYSSKPSIKSKNKFWSCDSFFSSIPMGIKSLNKFKLFDIFIFYLY